MGGLGEVKGKEAPGSHAHVCPTLEARVPTGQSFYSRSHAMHAHIFRGTHVVSY